MMFKYETKPKLICSRLSPSSAKLQAIFNLSCFFFSVPVGSVLYLTLLPATMLCALLCSGLLLNWPNITLLRFVWQPAYHRIDILMARPILLLLYRCRFWLWIQKIQSPKKQAFKHFTMVQAWNVLQRTLILNQQYAFGLEQKLESIVVSGVQFYRLWWRIDDFQTCLLPKQREFWSHQP